MRVIKDVINRDYLLQLILRKGSSICHLADSIGVSRNTISRIVNGYTVPSLEVVHLIRDFLALDDVEVVAIFHPK
ncbi:helix-turn-helix transcriptional regulator [Aerococcaceae bacterium zg-ZUI334]|uniref:helix-turn-helix domain-containing protein n=1 Tax=Aerococcaceae TaxID=186827 RepID=UPI0013D86879|nr:MULTISPECIES: helix-turn-helix transcriptional regulator [unclassified Facklamia]MBR7928320.1 helix-turn-helix transcriptional regulator [Aerococcaceae bacterium zg-ZUI334]MBS4461059.1 helix-turn-helix transcriptional regulator [Aerococcaceae bacterium zg-B36]QQD64908.1 helix-turn-helix transcriptional regulator [Aerococcaceae bacterium zg-252]